MVFTYIFVCLSISKRNPLVHLDSQQARMQWKTTQVFLSVVCEPKIFLNNPFFILIEAEEGLNDAYSFSALRLSLLTSLTWHLKITN